MRAAPVLIAVILAFSVSCGDNEESAPSPTPAPSPDNTTATATPSTPDQATLPKTTLVFNNSAGESIELETEVADDARERGRGLMFRETMPENAGMIFIYEEDHHGSFYMKSTLIPLSIAFVLADGTIIDIQDMEPETLETHRPEEAYRHAIEANQGWYQRNGIAPGDTVAIPDDIIP